MRSRSTAWWFSALTYVVGAFALLAALHGPASAQEYRIPQGWFPQLKQGTDIGKVRFPGKIEIDVEGYLITLTGTGMGIGGRQDGGYFAWKKVSGDVACQTYATWKTLGTFANRKAGLMMRAGLEPDDPYVSVVAYDPKVVAMQYRMVKGGETAEVRSPIPGPQSFTLERTGNQYRFVMEGWDNRWHPIGTITVPLPDSLYVGFVMCSSDPYVREAVTFGNMTFFQNGAAANSARVLESSLETMDIQTGTPSFGRFGKELIEAPSWSRDGAALLYNGDGHLFTISPAGGMPQQVVIGTKELCTRGHGFSWDGSSIAFSHQGKDKRPRISVVPAKGGKPRLVTKNGPSYGPSWSPDAKILVYCAERKGESDVYTIPASGGNEKRLTSAPGVDGGPEYSPDGKVIYFHSDRTGKMKIWKMHADGTGQEQCSPDDDYADWFPHPSPDGKYLLFLSYHTSAERQGSLQDAVLRLMPVGGGEVKTLAHVVGGQGTLDAPSWSPDSKKFAFVSYRLVSR